MNAKPTEVDSMNRLRVQAERKAALYRRALLLACNGDDDQVAYFVSEADAQEDIAAPETIDTNSDVLSNKHAEALAHIVGIHRLRHPDDPNGVTSVEAVELIRKLLGWKDVAGVETIYVMDEVRAQHQRTLDAEGVKEPKND